MRQETIGFWDAVASAGPYANNLHCAPDRQPHQHPSLNFYRPDALPDALTKQINKSKNREALGSTEKQDGSRRSSGYRPISLKILFTLHIFRRRQSAVVANSLHTAYADATRQFCQVGSGDVTHTRLTALCPGLPR